MRMGPDICLTRHSSRAEGHASRFKLLNSFIIAFVNLFVNICQILFNDSIFRSMVLNSPSIQRLTSSSLSPEIYNLTNSKLCTIFSNKVVDLFDYSDVVGIRSGFTR